MNLIQSLLNGLIEGLLLAVLAVAFSLVYATTRVFYLALGAIYTAAPYVLLATLNSGLSWVLGAPGAVLLAVAVGVAAEEFMHWPLERRRAPSDVHFISSLGAFLVISQVVVLIWGHDPQVLRASLDTVYETAGLRTTQGQVLGAVVALAALVGVFAWLQWTQVGLTFRAMASNSALLATLGSDIRKLRRIVFGLSGALAAIIALAVARDVGFDPNTGMRTVLVGVAATIVGGRSSFGGAAVAGFLFGVLRAQVSWYASARWEDATTFVLLALFLLVMPAGLKGLTTAGAKRLEDV